MADKNEEVSEIYSQVKNEVLEDFREVLVKRIDPQRFFPLLRSKKIFDIDDEEEIMCEKTSSKKTGKFLDILAKKGQIGFDVFCEGLLTQVAGQLDLLKKLLNAFEEKLEPELIGMNNQRQLPSSLVVNQTLPRPGELGGPELPAGYMSGFAQIYHSEPPPAYTD